jgi:hypothetical protein
MFIVVEPCFAEGHLLEAHIRNICEFLCPDHFIIVEGMFPKGPEDSLSINETRLFSEKYTIDGSRSFDIEMMRDIVKRCQNDYRNTTIHWIEATYDINFSTTNAYQYVYLAPTRLFTLQPDDTILAVDTDMLFQKAEADLILEKLRALSPGDSFGLSVKEVFVAPYISPGTRGKWGGFKWGGGDLYRKLFSLCTCQGDYLRCIPYYISAGWHYSWLRPPEYFDMRIAQLKRPAYITNYLYQAREIINNGGQDLQKNLNALCCQGNERYIVMPWTKEDHPVQIYGHPNFQYYDSRGNKR